MPTRPAFRISSHGPVVIAVVSGDAPLESAQQLRRTALDVAGQYPAGHASLTVVEKDAPPPSTELRDALARNIRELEGTLKANVLVFEGKGFQAAGLRAAVALLAFLSGSRQSVVSSVEEGARQVVAQLGLAGAEAATAALVAKVASLRNP